MAAGCEPCTKHHVSEARAAGANDRQMRLAVDDALCVRRNATDVIGRHSDVLLGVTPGAAAACCNEKSVLRELTSISAAFAVNCPNNLATHMAAARRQGATERQIQTAIGLARSIKKVAASHVENAADPSLANADESTAEALATPGCGCDGGSDEADCAAPATSGNEEAAPVAVGASCC